jgi:two-component system sensor histidine kinase YesM
MCRNNNHFGEIIMMKYLDKLKKFSKQHLKFSGYSLKTKLIIIFIIISILPIVTVQIISYEISQYYLEKKITDLSNSNLFYIKTNIETDMNYFKDILFRITADNDCLQLEDMFDNGDSFQKAASINKIRDAFAAYIYSSSQIEAITFVSKDGRNVYYDKKNQGIYNRIWDTYSDFTKEKIYSEIMESTVPVILPTTSNNYNGENSEYMFHIGLRVINIFTKEKMGIMIMSFNEKVLSDIYNVKTESLNKDKTNVCSLIIDNDGKIVSFQNKKYIGTYVEDYSKGKVASGDNVETLNTLVGSLTDFTNKHITVNSISIDSVGWKVINIIDKDSLFYEVNLLKYLTFGILITIIIMVMIIIIIFSNKFYKSVKIIVEGMNEVKKGNFNVKIELKTEDELAFIGNEFNKMSSKISSLIGDIKKQEEYIIEISNKRREAEIKAIVAQINPHFLYNTLDCINWMALENDQYEVSDMIGNLAQILRYSIGDINKEVSVYDEIQWLRKYAFLQQIRFNDSFILNLDVNEEILGCRIHKLLLQPFVENSLIHGFKGFDSGRELNVTINKLQNSYLIITIKDNGNGISKEKLHKITCSFKFRNKEDENIGVKNVYDRMKIYYGETSKLEISSEEGNGTTVTLIIPLIL